MDNTELKHRIPRRHMGAMGYERSQPHPCEGTSTPHQQFITMEVKKRGAKPWLFTAVYANPHVRNRDELWIKLSQFAERVSIPWMVDGDFNETRSLHERDHGGDNMMRRCARFANWIENNGLIDLGYSGLCFTWARGNTWETRKSAQLDRALCNTQWRARFQEGAVRHLIRSYSNHCPMLIDLNGFLPIMRNAKSFRFQLAWTSHKHFDEYLKLHWKGGLSLVPAYLADDLTTEGYYFIYLERDYGELGLTEQRNWSCHGRWSADLALETLLGQRPAALRSP
ncbi:hypothetical protein Cgig2_007671 [Carnegiea gigantea]|uniref:Endonuclease/exonuclease/phosphatase domain-containing protein n=1 Tax=Carnegiea gigantea TaxID=171969 RepID=A0A9Q1K3E3_9CARY|nr:hypothetical protein Cgig2_007671 [Carnegiea gigantea]